MKGFFSLIFSCVLLIGSNSCSNAGQLKFYPANDPQIRYTGRIDFSNPLHPRFWQPGVYIEWQFEGSDCEMIINDEVLWGNSHNYLEIVVDGKARRIQTKSRTDTIQIAKGLPAGKHLVMISKNTEAGIGYLELTGVRCEKLVALPPAPTRKIEFIGNSITCGMGSDQSEVACDKGVWYDQHNAYLSYGAITARTLNAQYHLSAVSGIGLMHSCCNMKVIMPQVFDKVNMREDTIAWDFKRYQPDVVTVCLGQNDGIQDSLLFCNNYITFLERLRQYYPAATIVCLNSPMGDEKLTIAMKKYLTAITEKMQKTDKKIHAFFYSRQYNSGCSWHPSLEEHRQIAEELTAFVKKLMKW
ncbi:MAG: acetyl xylan esterase [Chitinophagaceae bacterium]|nr:MAG: acetyl xylan esterase [Chitinophagaceae bacterium]